MRARGGLGVEGEGDGQRKGGVEVGGQRVGGVGVGLVGRLVGRGSIGG